MTKSLYGLPIETTKEQKEFNREEELENLNVMVEERLSKKNLDDLQWAKEFMERYENARKKTPKGGLRGKEGKLLSEVY